jgi:hypothetical protein
MNIDELHEYLLDQILLSNESNQSQSAWSLFEIYIEHLQESGQFVDDFTPIEFGIKGVHFSAFSRDVERSVLNLFVTDYHSSDAAHKVYHKDLAAGFSTLISVLEDDVIPEARYLDESNTMREFVDDITSVSGLYESLNIWWRTNSVYSSRTAFEETGSLNGLHVESRLVDLQAYLNMVKDKDQQNIDIDCELQGVKVIETDYYTSYLASVSGYDLVTYYNQYGKRLLESNVRTFLSLRGNVNKGIYNTLRSGERIFFFAYNNGLSGTASHVNFEDGRIKSIRNLQIVNGGQTMSTIFKAQKDGVDISGVHVQMKLSVIHDKENYTAYVSKISEYANTQNKVNKSDFFSNTYFHKRFKEISQRLRVPARRGVVTSSKWFYERVKGEYLNDQMYMSNADRKKFLLEYPKDQVIDKIAIAKASLAWDLAPNEVARGAQLCFAKFAEKVSDLYDEGDPDCNEYLFQKTVSQVILFKRVGKMVSGAFWYQGYRAQTIAYTIAMLSKKLRENRMTLNWDKIWKDQELEPLLEAYLDSIAEVVHAKILSPPPGVTNIGTYCKTPGSWTAMERLLPSLDEPPFIDSIVSIGEDKKQRTIGKKIERLDTSINNQVKVMELSGTQTPKKLLAFYNSKMAPGITDTARSLLSKWHDGKMTYPSEKQAKVIINALQKAVKAGFSE